MTVAIDIADRSSVHPTRHEEARRLEGARAVVDHELREASQTRDQQVRSLVLVGVQDKHVLRIAAGWLRHLGGEEAAAGGPPETDLRGVVFGKEDILVTVAVEIR